MIIKNLFFFQNFIVRLSLPLFLTLIIGLASVKPAASIQCYSGSQFNIIECPSLNCIKQTLGLDTVRYCDGTGTSSICATYRVIEDCQNVPNLGEICCCTDQLCNSASLRSLSPLLVLLLTVIASCALYFCKISTF